MIFSSGAGTTQYRQLRNHPKYAKIRNRSFTNEMRRLCQSVGKVPNGSDQRIEGTDTLFVIDYENIPCDWRKDITYTSVVCTVRPQKEDPNCTRITICFNHICYLGDVLTPTASLELFKLVVSSVLSWRGARYSTLDIKNFYLGTPLDRPKYGRGTDQDVHFFYTPSHLSELKGFKLIISNHFLFILIFK